MITDLIANGQAKIDEMQRKSAEKERQRLAENTAEIERRELELAEVLKENFPPELLEYIGACTELDAYSNNNIIYRIDAPECTAVSFQVEATFGGEDRNYHYTRLAKFAPREYSQDRDRYCYRVDVPIVYQDDDNGYMVGGSNYQGIDDLEVALAYAHMQWLRLPKLKAEADEKNAKLADKQARKQAAAEAEELAQAKADAQLADMMDDPVMGPLLNLVNAIMKEHADLNQRISDMSEAMETSEYYHSEAMSRLERRVSEEAQRRSEAEREKDNAEYEAREAEDKLKKATKKAGVWG